jgi:hypothetical protein
MLCMCVCTGDALLDCDMVLDLSDLYVFDSICEPGVLIVYPVATGAQRRSDRRAQQQRQEAACTVGRAWRCHKARLEFEAAMDRLIEDPSKLIEGWSPRRRRLEPPANHISNNISGPAGPAAPGAPAHTALSLPPIQTPKREARLLDELATEEQVELREQLAMEERLLREEMAAEMQELQHANRPYTEHMQEQQERGAAEAEQVCVCPRTRRRYVCALICVCICNVYT